MFSSTKRWLIDSVRFVLIFTYKKNRPKQHEDVQKQFESTTKTSKSLEIAPKDAEIRTPFPFA